MSPRMLAFGALLASGLLLSIGLASVGLETPLGSSLVPAFRLLGGPLQSLDRLAGRGLPVDEIDERELGLLLRERYEAQLSLTYSEGEEVFILAGEEGPLRRNLDLLSMATHLVSKHDWVEALPGDDFVARFRVRDLAEYPERMDELIGEIAMGRSILEG